MKRKYVSCALSIALLVSLQGCVVVNADAIRGSGSVSEETYDFSGITGVQLSTLGELDIRLGDKEELRIEADDNLLQYFETGANGGVLKIGTRSGFNLRPSRSVRPQCSRDRFRPMPSQTRPGVRSAISDGFRPWRRRASSPRWPGPRVS